jgi:predicted nucleic acid-binding protein
MRVVVADATPLHYLILIDAIDSIFHLFEKIYVPAEVRDELTHAAAPAAVKAWMHKPPDWMEIASMTRDFPTDPVLAGLDAGESAAITLAEALHADLLLIDERTGAAIAQNRGLLVTGTLGVLDLASRAGLLDLRKAFERLRKTNFRYPPSLMATLLDEEERRRNRS